MKGKILVAVMVTFAVCASDARADTFYGGGAEGYTDYPFLED